MLSKFSVKKVYTVFVAVIAVIILGIISFLNMKTDLLPSMEFPYVMIMTSYPGASPEKIEKTVTDTLEDNLSSVSDIKKIESVSSENVSIITMEFESDANMDSVLIEINSKINIVEGMWSDDLISSPIVTKINPNMIPIMITSVDLKGSTPEELTKIVNDNVIPQIEKVGGVASVTPYGLAEDNVVVKLNQSKIDSINKKLIRGVNKGLSNTSGKLYSALNKIEKGKESLTKTQNEKLTEITNGQEDIDKNINLINTSISMITSNKNNALNDNLILNTRRNSIIDKLNELEAKINFINHNPLLSETEKQTQINSVESDIFTLRNELAEKENLISANEDIINELNNNLSEMNNNLNTLKNTKKDLENAKFTLTNEISKAYTSLLISESKINDAITEYNQARDEALKNANIDGIVTMEMISNILVAENFSMPAGYIEKDEEDIVVKVGEKFNSIEELKKLTLFSYDIRGLENVRLCDVADVSLQSKREDYVEINNEAGIVLSIQKQSNASTSQITKDINESMKKIEKTTGVSITNLMDQGIYIDIIIKSVINNLLYGAILAIIVLLLFLKDYKPTITIALSIPISLMLAVVLMYFSGVTINIISLSGLALGVGMLVDNSIVVIENIYRLRLKGVNSKIAAVEGAKGVASAISASTLTTVCVFLPIVFITGITKQLFADMGLTIAYSLLASLIVALTLVPAISSKLFRKNSIKENKLLTQITKKYGIILEKSLNKKWIVITSVLVLFVISILLTTTMGTEFIPQMQTNQMSITLNFEEETKEKERQEIATEVTKEILKIEDVEKVGSIESTSLSSVTQSNSISLYIILKEKKREYSNSEIKEMLSSSIKPYNCEEIIQTSNMNISMLTGEGIKVVIKGEDDQKLLQSKNDIEKLLLNTKGIKDVTSSIDDNNNSLMITIDKNKAMKNNLTVAGIYSIISSKLKNEINSTILEIDNKEYQVIIEGKNKTNINDISKLIIESNDKKIILNEIADIKTQTSSNSISHTNQVKYVFLSATLEEGYNIGKVGTNFENVFNKYAPQDGITVELEGENESINQALKDIFLMISLSIILIYLIMVAQFQSLKYPFIVLFTIPLAITGGLLALLICGKMISLISMLGFLILCGIVVNNAIVFIDYTNQLISESTSIRESLIEAGKTRIKPILMTSLTTILGLATMAIGVGMGTEAVSALAIVTIGGLIYATILTLIFIPVIYELLNQKNLKSRVK